jgi:hypothetical protein
MPARALPILVLAGLALAACATQPTPTGGDAPGFWLGFVHGVIAPFSLIASLFREVRLYAFPNGGGWYDLGFLLGIAGALGGGAKVTIVWRRA